MSLPYPICRHLHHSLSGIVPCLWTMLGPIPPVAEFWDRRTEEGRYSPREVLAHLADWDVIFLDRIDLILTQVNPEIPELDEDRLPTDHDYAHQNPVEALERFAEARDRLVQRVRGLSEADWARTGTRGDMGSMSVAEQIVLVGIHDGYHLRQIADYVSE